jgi:Sulfotransferase domain
LKTPLDGLLQSLGRHLGKRGPRTFCISMQRTGTSSVGKFFRDFGFRWAGWPADRDNQWSSAWYEGDYERIFHSRTFRDANAFEDSPWFLPGFYRILFHRFPGSRFILFTRDPDAWFTSMVNHSRGDVIGRTRTHCKVYRREPEYFELVRSGVMDETAQNQLQGGKRMKILGHDEHYKQVFALHNRKSLISFPGTVPRPCMLAAWRTRKSGRSWDGSSASRFPTTTPVTKTGRRSQNSRRACPFVRVTATQSGRHAGWS